MNRYRITYRNGDDNDYALEIAWTAREAREQFKAKCAWPVDVIRVDVDAVDVA